MSNKIVVGKQAREVLKVGAGAVHSVVAPTLGANGRNVVFNKWSRVPVMSNDGATLARETEPSDPSEAQGAHLIKQVSERTNDEAGDGTTTSIVLAYSIMDEGMKLLDDTTKKINPMKLRRQITEATNEVLTALRKQFLMRGIMELFMLMSQMILVFL